MKRWRKRKKIYAGAVLAAVLVVIVICIIIHNRNRYYINPVSVFTYYEPESELLKICEDGEVKEEIYIPNEQYSRVTKYYGYDGTTLLLITLDNVYLYSDGRLSSVQKGKWQEVNLSAYLSYNEIVSANAKKVAYIENDNLYLLDMEKQEIVLIDENVENDNIIISANGGAVAYYKMISLGSIAYGEYYIYVNGEKYVFEGSDIVSLTDDGEGYCGYGEVYYFYPDGNMTCLSYDCSYYEVINVYGNQIMYYDFTSGQEGVYIASKDKSKKIEGEKTKYDFYYYGSHDKIIPQYSIRIDNIEFRCQYSYDKDLYDSYIGCDAFEHIDKNGNLEKIADYNVNCFAAFENTDYVYYSTWASRDSDEYRTFSYNKKNKTITEIGGKSSTAFNYMNTGAYLMMDYDKQTERGTVYYIEDGSTLVPVMEDITEIEVHGKYVYLIQLFGNRSEGYYNVYIGDPNEGYRLFAEKVRCSEIYNLHFRTII